MRSTPRIAALLLAISSTVCSVAQQSLTAAEANSHVGQPATVWGRVAGAHYASGSKGQPTFINLDKPYPIELCC